jgi:hypothetical protein
LEQLHLADDPAELEFGQTVVEGAEEFAGAAELDVERDGYA